MKKKINVINSVAWIYKRNNTILCVRTKGKDKFYIPGGKFNTWETPNEALIREIQEELSVNLVEESIQLTTTIYEKAHGFEDTFVNMQCFYADYIGDLKVCAEIEELRWMGLNDISLCALAAQKAIIFALKA